MFEWLRKLLRGPRPAGPPRTVRRFDNGAEVLGEEVQRAGEEGWVVASAGNLTARLFEVADPQVENCILGYRAVLRTRDVGERAYLEMWCRLPGGGEFFSRGFHNASSGTTEWREREIPFYLKRGQRPDLIKLNVVIEGGGEVAVRDVDLRATPLQ